jgi:predicted dehydrogenase
MAALRAAGIDNFRVTALCARDRRDAETFRRRGEGPPPRPPAAAPPDPLGAPHMYVSDLHEDTLPAIYTDLHELLAADQVDALLVLSPVYLHHSHVIAGLQAGKHVLVEKPMAVSVRAAQAMLAAARRAGRVLGVAEVVRYSPAVRSTSWLINQGALGAVQLYVSGGLGTADWSPNRIVAGTPWRHRKLQAGGGPTIDMAVHLFDGVRAYAGEIVEISGMVATQEPRRFTFAPSGAVTDEVPSEVEDTFFVTFRLAGGGLGQLFFSWACHGEPVSLDARTAVYGTRGCLKGDLLILDDGTRGSAAGIAHERADEAARSSFRPRGLQDPFAIQFQDFLSAIEANRPMEVSGEEGLRDLAAAYAILESSVAHCAVSFDDVLAGKVRAYQEEIDSYYGL